MVICAYGVSVEFSWWGDVVEVGKGRGESEVAGKGVEGGSEREGGEVEEE